jgi:hypothetical protein
MPYSSIAGTRSVSCLRLFSADDNETTRGKSMHNLLVVLLDEK